MKYETPTAKVSTIRVIAKQNTTQKETFIDLLSRGESFTIKSAKKAGIKNPSAVICKLRNNDGYYGIQTNTLNEGTQKKMFIYQNIG